MSIIPWLEEEVKKVTMEITALKYSNDIIKNKFRLDLRDITDKTHFIEDIKLVISLIKKQYELDKG